MSSLTSCLRVVLLNRNYVEGKGNDVHRRRHSFLSLSKKPCLVFLLSAPSGLVDALTCYCRASWFEQGAQGVLLIGYKAISGAVSLRMYEIIEYFRPCLVRPTH